MLLLALATAKKSAKSNDEPKKNLIAMAAQNTGLIRLNDETFDLITSPDRDWSAIVQFTALKSTYKCEPCKYVFLDLFLISVLFMC